MNTIETLKQQLEKAVKSAVELNGNLDQHAAESRRFFCNMANDLLDKLELLGEDPEELLAAIDV
jgi:hypothetical protein